MKNLFAIFCVFVLSFCSSAEDSSDTSIQPTTPVPSIPTYYCSINGVTYYEEVEYREKCVNQIISSSSAKEVQESSSSIKEYCCERTGKCYSSQAVYDIQCLTPPSREKSSSSQACTKCDCNSYFQKLFEDTYNVAKRTAACASSPSACESTAKKEAAKRAGCEL